MPRTPHAKAVIGFTCDFTAERSDMKSSLKDFPRKISCPLRRTLIEGCSYAMKVTETLPLRPETILFVGAGATARLKMPTTDEQAGIIWNLCENDLTAQLVEQSAGCFQGKGQAIVDLFRVVDSGVEADAQPALAPDLCERVFPGLGDADVQRLVTGLRRHYDWSALKLIAKAKKGGECKTIGGEKPRDELAEFISSRSLYVKDVEDCPVFPSSRPVNHTCLRRSPSWTIISRGRGCA